MLSQLLAPSRESTNQPLRIAIGDEHLSPYDNAEKNTRIFSDSLAWFFTKPGTLFPGTLLLSRFLANLHPGFYSVQFQILWVSLKRHENCRKQMETNQKKGGSCSLSLHPMLEQTVSYQAVETQSEEKKNDSNFWGYSCSLKYAES